MLEGTFHFTLSLELILSIVGVILGVAALYSKRSTRSQSKRTHPRRRPIRRRAKAKRSIQRADLTELVRSSAPLPDSIPRSDEKVSPGGAASQVQLALEPERAGRQLSDLQTRNTRA